MEEIKITKESKFSESINKWCVAIWCSRDKNSIWTGGFFHKKREIAEKMAMDSFRKSLKFYQEIEKPLDEKVELLVTV